MEEYKIKNVSNRIKYTCICGYFKIVDGGKDEN